MPQPNDLKRLVVTGAQLTENGRSHALRVGVQLAAQGRLTTEHASAAFDELAARARQRNKELQQAVRAEVQRQLHRLGLATRDHRAELERRFAPAAAPRTKRATKGAAATTGAINQTAMKKSE